MQHPGDLQRFQASQPLEKPSPSPNPWLGLEAKLSSRRPVRISVTVSQLVHDELVARSNAEGRSLSNLAAFLLESALTPASTPAFSNPVQTGRAFVPEPVLRAEM